MPVLLLEKDPFVEALDAASSGGAMPFEELDVRRPLAGMMGKRTRYAFLSVYRADGGAFTQISLVDSSAKTVNEEQGYSSATHNFLLTAVQHQIQEKQQIVETFGDYHVFFYGQKPQFLQCSGILLNSRDFNWKNEWLRNYNRYLRGTKCVESRARVYLGFDDVLVSGYIINTATSYDAQNPKACPFNFTFLVTDYRDLSEGNTDYDSSGKDAVGWDDSNGMQRADKFAEEYLTEFSSTTFQSVDTSTGEVKTDHGASEGSAEAAGQPETATWVGDGSAMKLWRDESDALTEIDTELAAQQSGSDRLTSRRALRESPASFPLASRSDDSSSLATALSAGVSNGAFKIEDHPSVSR